MHTRTRTPTYARTHTCTHTPTSVCPIPLQGLDTEKSIESGSSQGVIYFNY